MKERRRAARIRWSCLIAGGVLFVAAGGLIVFRAIVPQAEGDPAAQRDAIRLAWVITFGLATFVSSVIGPPLWIQWKALRFQEESKELQAKSLELQREQHAFQVKKDEFDRVEARQRQVNDQFEQACAMLSSDSVAARIAGVKALDRLGREHLDLREDIVEVWCSLLRMRVGDPAEQDDVRALVQRLLLEHLRAPYEGTPTTAVGSGNPEYWELRRIDLSGADLVDADFTDCLLPNFCARRARFWGTTHFTKARFAGPATFTGAQGKGPVDFTGVFFADECTMDSLTIEVSADFAKTVFQGPFESSSSTFTGPVTFTHAKFLNTARFSKSNFGSTADFTNSKWVFKAEFTSATFEDYAGFSHTSFIDRAVFGRASFGAAVSFEGAQFGRNALFTGITCCGSASFNDAYFDEDVAFDDAQFAEIAGFRRIKVWGQMTCCGARFDALAAFRGAKFTGRVDFSSTVLGKNAAVDCTDATAALGDYLPSDRIWPTGWTTINELTTLRLIPLPDPKTDLAPTSHAPTT
ncbi:hypothetical protein K3N28_05960 [Glycomyces sp. TRM65418]|uniref:pentapeptide repeat-containing protein n=1 Tax=Glycomyces sp. TRM65418 TaxID=2867006 RepID=UPI001CE70FEA|nr:hypothetical protein [Glycomyces sp. TRM65418]MCC3762614.1 hypothetical protein [Glycomyces sp. TRM65418]QZD56652.1 hypothetical protein K3N28_05920 [Glycomyces sp. TRM65418]